MTTIYTSDRYTVTSHGNGVTMAISRNSDGASVFFQDDAAPAFSAELDATHERWTFDDVCSQYDDIMTGNNGDEVAARR